MLNFKRPALALLVDCQAAPLDIFSADIDLIFLRDRQAGDNRLKDAIKFIQLQKCLTTKLIINSEIYKNWFKKTKIAGWHLPESTKLTACHPSEGWDPDYASQSQCKLEYFLDPSLRWDDKPTEKDKRSFVGRSVHSVAATQKAVTEKIDYVIAGTMFDTVSHPGKIPEGVQLLRDIKAVCPALPMLAIGGITPDNAAQCLDAGACGIVVQSGILSAKDPVSAIQNYRQVLDEHYSHTQRQSSHAG